MAPQAEGDGESDSDGKRKKESRRMHSDEDIDTARGGAQSMKGVHWKWQRRGRSQIHHVDRGKSNATCIRRIYVLIYV